ncbi:unnamed protein product [Durusdinium trenchii]|uniref:Uncharacterized protein n=1 Tax=Durusdinium trenchii TaxID=1381693 RepID=A0ABP0QGP5_9DINO
MRLLVTFLAAAGAVQPEVPWIGRHALKAAEEHEAVAQVAAESSKASHEALLSAQAALSARDAARQSRDFLSAQVDPREAIQKELDQARDWAQEARAYASHAEQTFAEMRSECLRTLGPCCAGLWTIMDPKGERLYCAALPPAVAPLPACLRRPARVAFDGAAYDLRAAAVEVLEKAQLGSWKSDRLEEYTAPGEIFRCFRVRQALHRCVEESTGFLEVYERLVQKVLVPWLKQQAELSERTRFSYQFPPTLRLQPGNSEEFKRPHRDAEYGHQVGELNFWMPLTDYSLTRSTLWVESEPGKGDYQPLEMSYGEIAVFHGTLCRHHVPANSSPFCRISMDFRIGVGEFFDPHWTLKGVKHIHQRREIWL